MKKIYGLLLGIFFCNAGFAQFVENWNVRYQTTTTANFSNEGRKVVVDGNSNVFVLGDYSSDLDSSGHVAGTTQYSVRIHKYDFQGNFLTWAYIPVNGLVNNGYDNRSGFGLELDASGNVYVAYSILNGSGNFDIVIAKYNNNLVRIWAHTYTTSSNDVGVDFKLSGNTAYAVVKSYSGANYTYSIIAAEAGGTSTLALYSFIPNVDVVSSIALTSGKFFFVTGSSLIGGAKQVMTAGISVFGVLKWKANFNNGPTTSDDYGSQVIVGLDGMVYVIGTGYTNAASGTDAILLKYNSTGVLIRSILLNRNTSDVGYKIANGPSGYIFAACGNSFALAVYKIATSGNSLTASTFYYNQVVPNAPHTGITSVTVEDMKVAASNNVYLCGNVNATSAAGNFSAAYYDKIGFSGFIFTLLNSQPVDGDFLNSFGASSLSLDGNKTDMLFLRNTWGNNSNHSSERYYLQDLDAGASMRMGESGLNNSDVTIYPNPAKDQITVSSEGTISSIVITDMTGQEVKRLADLNRTVATLQVNDLKQGLYVCKTISESGLVKLQKIIIE